MRILKRFDIATKKYISYEALDTWEMIRSKIIERDNHECTSCHKNKRLAVHHKDISGNLPLYQKPNNSPDNLITLCFSCHAKIHYEHTGKIKNMGVLI